MIQPVRRTNPEISSCLNTCLNRKLFFFSNVVIVNDLGHWVIVDYVKKKKKNKK